MKWKANLRRDVVIQVNDFTSLFVHEGIIEPLYNVTDGGTTSERTELA